jgi:cbb3-type cytochrome oxidase cytochrome c subunit
MLKRILKIIAILIVIVIILFILIQFIPYGKNHTNPPIVSEPNWDSQQTRDLAKRACFDCHSNETTWPWYSNIAPVSWLVYRDVVQGRERLNFSDWQNLHLREPGEITSIISEGEMPPYFYLPLHPTASLSSTEKTQLINGLTATLSR